jgi:hypothetical protein
LDGVFNKIIKFVLPALFLSHLLVWISSIVSPTKHQLRSLFHQTMHHAMIDEQVKMLSNNKTRQQLPILNKSLQDQFSIIVRHLQDHKQSKSQLFDNNNNNNTNVCEP